MFLKASTFLQFATSISLLFVSSKPGRKVRWLIPWSINFQLKKWPTITEWVGGKMTLRAPLANRGTFYCLRGTSKLEEWKHKKKEILWTNTQVSCSSGWVLWSIMKIKKNLSQLFWRLLVECITRVGIFYDPWLGLTSCFIEEKAEFESCVV